MSLLGFISRRPLVSLVGAAGLWWCWPSSEEPVRAPAPGDAAGPGVQAAVLADGFAAIDASNRIVELDDEGGRRREVRVTGAPAGARVVGLADSVGLVWRDGKRIAVAQVDPDGGLEDPERYGKRVAALCEGVATNEHQYGVGWFEAAGDLWFVHGPTSRAARAVERLAAEPGAGPMKADRCAIASAGKGLALLWTAGSRVQLAICGQRCSPSRRLELPKKSELVGFGCHAAGCAVVTRSAAGSLEATWVTTQGKTQWTKPLPHARGDSRVALAGAGTRVAIAYATSNEPVVVAASHTGSITTLWQGAADAVPSIVATGGSLLVARHVDGELTGSIVRVP